MNKVTVVSSAMTVNRHYESAVRSRAARVTKSAVVQAAHDLFVEKGYVATTVDQIAARAGVSKPTVFASVGSKATVLKEVRDVAIAGDDAPIPIAERGWYKRMLSEPDPRRTLSIYARNVTAINDRYADVDHVLVAAAAAEPALNQLWNTSEDERMRGAAIVVDNLAQKAELRRDRSGAIDIVWTLTAPEQLRRLVRIRGWTLPRFERWLTDTFCEQLL